MGLSLTTQHIHNPAALTKAQFKKAFCEYMKSKGYTTATEDTAELTYALVFSKDRRWVTVLSEDETDPRSASAEYAKSLGTYAVMVELVDSDFAELSLFDETGAHIDTLILGESYLEDAAPMGEPSAWQPLMVGSWEQVEAIQNGSYTFAEEAVADFAPVIGMDGENILLDNDSKVDEKSAVTLYFKTAKEKKLTLNSAFIKIFGEYLEPLGFVRLKGHNTFVRLVNGEFLHIISCMKDNGVTFTHPIAYDFPETRDMTKFIEWLRSDQVLVKFVIRCGVKTIYDYFTDEYPYSGGASISQMYICGDQNGGTRDYYDRVAEFAYEKGNEKSLIAEMMFVLELTKRYILPEFEGVDSYEACIDFDMKFNRICNRDHWYLKTGRYHEILEKRFETYKAETIYEYKYEYEKRRKRKPLEEEIESIRRFIDKDIRKLEDLESDIKRYDEMMKQLEENKEKGLKLLRESGVKIGVNNNEE